MGCGRSRALLWGQRPSLTCGWGRAVWIGLAASEYYGEVYGGEVMCRPSMRCRPRRSYLCAMAGGELLLGSGINSLLLCSGISVAPKSVSVAPRSVAEDPKCVSVAARGASVAPKGISVAPRGVSVAPGSIHPCRSPIKRTAVRATASTQHGRLKTQCKVCSPNNFCELRAQAPEGRVRVQGLRHRQIGNRQ
jgi:hypothetical protein